MYLVIHDRKFLSILHGNTKVEAPHRDLSNDLTEILIMNTKHTMSLQLNKQIFLLILTRYQLQTNF